MIIEVLYPEVCCLYGDKGNTLLLKKALPKATFIETSINEEPHFVSHHVDLCYIASMSEKNQSLVIEQLKPFTEIIEKLIETNETIFLCTGPAIEIFGQSICYENKNKTIDGLQIFNYHTKNLAPKRFNTLIEMTFNNMHLIGYTSRFSHINPSKDTTPFGLVSLGFGQNLETKNEGIFYKGFIGTYLLGPILVSNPDFTLWLLKQLDPSIKSLPFENELRQAYEIKCHEFKKANLELE